MTNESKSKLKYTEVPQELFETIYASTKELAEIACANHESVPDWALTDVYIFCFYHAGEHSIRKADRRGTWERLKKTLATQYPDELSAMIELSHVEFTRQIAAYGKTPVLARVIPKRIADVSTIELTEVEAQEFWECVKKNSYLNRAVAETAIRSAITDRDGLHSYSCEWGTHWHIGHPMQRSSDIEMESYYRNRIKNLAPHEQTKMQLFREDIGKRRRLQS